jgi:hypothetical protein
LRKDQVNKMAEKKKAVKVVQVSLPCDHVGCKFSEQCEYYSNGTYKIPDACMVCVFYMGVRFNALTE